MMLTTRSKRTILINLPDIQVDSGTILFFRPSGNALDRAYDLVINDNKKMILPKADFEHGKYILKINWKHLKKEYYTEQILFVK